jgi:hypothetical protein
MGEKNGAKENCDNCPTANGTPARLGVLMFCACYRATSREVIMKKRVKRTKSKSSLKRGRTKSKSKRTTSAKKSFLPKAKRVAKKAALAAGAAAIGTALSELQPEQRAAGRDASDESESKPRKRN